MTENRGSVNLMDVVRNHAVGSGGHGNHGHRDASLRVLIGVLVLNALFFGVEAVGGWVLGSLALLADALHMLTDVTGLVLAIVGQRLMARSATRRFSFGFPRSEVLAGLANGMLLVGSVAWVAYEAVRRVIEPATDDFEPVFVIVIGVVGLIVNLVSAFWLHGRRHESLNMKGAYLHMALDALGSLAVIGAAAGVGLSGWLWLDPVVSLGVVALVLVPALALIREAVHVLMEGTPRSVDLESLVTRVEGFEAVDDFHHVHVWELAANKLALSGHVTVAGEATLHEAQLLSDELSAVLADEFSIGHTTLALECHACG